MYIQLITLPCVYINENENDNQMKRMNFQKWGHVEILHIEKTS